MAQFEIRASNGLVRAYNINVGLSSTGGDFIDTTAPNITHTTTLTSVDEDGNEIEIPVNKTTTIS